MATDRELLALTVARVLREARDDWRNETHPGDASDFRRGYVTAAHAIFDDIEQRLGQQMLLLADTRGEAL